MRIGAGCWWHCNCCGCPYCRRRKNIGHRQIAGTQPILPTKMQSEDLEPWARCLAGPHFSWRSISGSENHMIRRSRTIRMRLPWGPKFGGIGLGAANATTRCSSNTVVVFYNKGQLFGKCYTCNKEVETGYCEFCMMETPLDNLIEIDQGKQDEKTNPYGLRHICLNCTYHFPNLV